MSNWILFLAVFAGGAAVATQPVVNARLAQRVGLIESAFISFATLAAAIAAQFAAGLVLDHLGVASIYGAPIDLKRMIGVGLLFLGALLILRH